MKLASKVFALACVGLFCQPTLVHAEDKANENSIPDWTYRPSLLQPFYAQEVIEQEPILFVLDPETKQAKGKLLFPVEQVESVTDSACKQQYEVGRDFTFVPGSNEIVLPADSRIKSVLSSELRREPGSQPYRLTHRDGNGEILFGGTLEYHQMQTWITYKRQVNNWPEASVAKSAGTLPKSRSKLSNKENFHIVLLGDSISTGCNASGWGKGEPFQPPYQDLLLQHLKSVSSDQVKLTNLAVGGMATPWGITKMEEVMSHSPDLVIIAFGMNDSSGLPPESYKANTLEMINRAKAVNPEVEIILVATMLGNKDWTVLKHELFPQYRDALTSLCTEGIALADLTTVWEEMLARKKDADLTGNGVNHPNDFGHRVYAQVLSQLLVPEKPKN